MERFKALKEGEGYKYIRRGVIILFGFTLFLVGVVMIFLPGPAILIIPLSLVVLGTEFVWARSLLKKMKEGGNRLKNFAHKK